MKQNAYNDLRGPHNFGDLVIVITFEISEHEHFGSLFPKSGDSF